MRSPTYHLALPAEDNHPSLHTVILYEDFAAGINGKVFSELVAEELAPNCRSRSSLWRLDVVDSPAIAEKVATEAATAALVIFSLRGDAALPASAQRWVKAQMRPIAGIERHIVLLSDESTRDAGVCAKLLEQLESACQGARTTISSYVGKTSRQTDVMSFQAEQCDAAESTSCHPHTATA